MKGCRPPRTPNRHLASAAVSNIGVLREGPLHAAVKAALAEPGDRLEVPVGRFVIDLVRADGELVEVQTGGFGALGKKLDALLDEHRIRIVYPVAAERRIVRVDEHGQVLGVRRSPKRATAAAVFDKLVAFPSLLTHPNLTIEVVLLREDHVRGPQPTTTRRRTRDPGERRMVEVLDQVALRTSAGHPRGAPRAAGRAVQYTRARNHSPLQHAAGAAHAVLPADDRHRRAGGQPRPRAAPCACGLTRISAIRSGRLVIVPDDTREPGRLHGFQEHATQGEAAD